MTMQGQTGKTRLNKIQILNFYCKIVFNTLHSYELKVRLFGPDILVESRIHGSVIFNNLYRS